MLEVEKFNFFSLVQKKQCTFDENNELDDSSYYPNEGSYALTTPCEEGFYIRQEGFGNGFKICCDLNSNMQSTEAPIEMKTEISN